MKLLRTLARGRGTTSRRQLLRALGVSAAAAPFVPALNGWAAPGSGPKRLVLLFSPHGVIPEAYWPTGTETSFTFPTGGILEPFEPHKGEMVVFKGLDRPTKGRGEHERCMCSLWTGSKMADPTQDASSASVDQIIAKALKPQTSFESLQFGVQCAFWAEGDVSKTNSPNSSMINAGPNERIYPENDPYKMFDRLFVGPVGPTTDSMQSERLRARRKSVLDFVKDELDDLGRLVGSADRNKIASHLEATRDVERRLQEPMRTCGAVTKPDGTLDLAANDNHPKIIPIMNALLVAALACDRTRIASMQVSRSFSNQKHTWLGAKDGHHSISHNAGAKAILSQIQRWYMTHFANLITAFRETDEGGTPMLDNMLVAYSAELYTPWNHVAYPSASFLLGKAGGALRTGRLLDYGGSNDHNQFLTTLCHAMDVRSVNKVGDLGKEGILPNVLA